MKKLKIFFVGVVLVGTMLGCNISGTSQSDLQQTIAASVAETQMASTTVGDSTYEAPNMEGVPTTTVNDQVGNLSPLVISNATWAIALQSVEEIEGYGDQVPGEGHKFHLLKFLVANITETPQLLDEDSLGFFYAKWQTYSYSRLALEYLSGYIPPGWPVEVTVVFDLPSVVESPTIWLAVYPENIQVDQTSPILDIPIPPTHKLGEEFIMDGILSIIPKELNVLPITEGSFSGRQLLLLNSTIKNLGGRDLNPGRHPLPRFQIFYPGGVAPITTNIRHYSFGWAPTLSNVWFAPEPTIAPDPFGVQPDTQPLAPGISRDGAYWMNLWPDTPSGLLLLVWGGMPNEWALYELDEDGGSLLNQPIRLSGKP